MNEKEKISNAFAKAYILTEDFSLKSHSITGSVATSVQLLLRKFLNYASFTSGAVVVSFSGGSAASVSALVCKRALTRLSVLGTFAIPQAILRGSGFSTWFFILRLFSWAAKATAMLSQPNVKPICAVSSMDLPSCS